MNKPGALLLLMTLLLCGCTYGSLGPSSCETSAPDSLCPIKETCPGQCVPSPPPEWSLPVLLWSGPELEAPACPAGILQYEGHADPIDPPKCPVCSCEPPTGECELPTYLIASTQTCAGDGPGPILYDFSGFDLDPTICNTDNPVPAILGTRSLTVGPVGMTETGCKPVATLPPRSGATRWKTFARACNFGVSACSIPGVICVPTAEPPPGFSQCIHQSGQHECPSDYPDRRVFYNEISDSRHCSECTCGVPKGGVCTAPLRMYQDASCMMVVTGGSYSLTETCCDIPAGTDLLSKKVWTAPIYEPGACEPIGGEPIGSVDLNGPSTFCCQ
jgi:hypothetical protein